MNASEHSTTDAYFEQARSWADTREDELLRSRRTAWLVAGLASVIALMAVVALLALAPLKTVVPYTLLVDRETGFVQSLNPASIPEIAPDSALTQSMLAQYITARESFDITDLQHAYRKVGLWSAGPAKQDYAVMMRADNPAGPLARLPRTTTVQVRVRSISPLGKKSALVRFETVRRDQAQRPEDPQSWVAIVRYHYSAAPMTMDDRLLNPLGFQVTSYRRDAEAPLSAAGDPDADVIDDNLAGKNYDMDRRSPTANATTDTQGLNSAYRSSESTTELRRNSRFIPQGSPLVGSVTSR